MCELAGCVTLSLVSSWTVTCGAGFGLTLFCGLFLNFCWHYLLDVVVWWLIWLLMREVGFDLNDFWCYAGCGFFAFDGWDVKVTVCDGEFGLLWLLFGRFWFCLGALGVLSVLLFWWLLIVVVVVVVVCFSWVGFDCGLFAVCHCCVVLICFGFV